MKLLFDQNISHRLLKLLRAEFHECGQVRALGLENKPDKDIWQYAKAHGYTVVTFDADFFNFADLYGHPPKVIWLRLGNTSTQYLAMLFNSKIDKIREFIEAPSQQNIACLELSSFQ